ncbi:UNVERIFIED_CONTAM: hypothetical protein Slati_1879400 [Sesamum latifolium]|uniref:Retrotransposon gag domain-containing protein n=1 Tax=Sesamum latifolium TaxID=2727402 RepID=A0AAW2X1T7_9LAMI
METINSILRGSQASGAEPSSQLERGGTPTSQGMDEQVPAGLQQDRSNHVDFLCKEAAGRQPPDIWKSLKKKMVELRQQVAKETLPTERAEYIRKFENAALLHRYTDGIKCRVFLTALTNSAQQWFNQLPAESVRSFTEFSSLFQHQFASNKKYQKSVISLFGVRQEDNETLRVYVQRFNTTILKVPTAHQEVLISAFTQGLYGGPLFESLAKKPAFNYLDVLTQA